MNNLPDFPTSCNMAPPGIERAVTRWTAFLTFSSLVIFLAYGANFILICVVVDFFLRGFVSGGLSPFAILARCLSQVAGGRPVSAQTNAKAFPARLGFVVSGSTLLCFWLGLTELAYGLSGLLLLCAGLESAFSFCLACRLSSALQWYRELQQRSARNFDA